MPQIKRKQQANRVNEPLLKVFNFYHTLFHFIQVRSVVIQSCEHLRFGLDLDGVNPSHIPFNISRSGHVLIDFIIFDPIWSGKQRLEMNFKQIQNVTFYQLHVDDTAFVSQNHRKLCINIFYVEVKLVLNKLMKKFYTYSIL